MLIRWLCALWFFFGTPVAWVTLVPSTPAMAAELARPILTVYTYDAFVTEWGAGPKVEVVFESICACDLRFVAVDSSAGILSRVLLEGENSPADIVLGLDNSILAEAEKTGLIAPHAVDLTPLALPVKWENPYFLPFDFGYFAFVYDHARLPDPPTSFEQLIADDTLKIVIQDPRSSTPGLGLLLWIKAQYGEQAMAVWQQIAPNILTVTRGWWEAYSMFLAGEADLVLSYTTSPAYHLHTEQTHQYRAAPFAAGHGLQIEVAAQLRASKQPQLAAQFMHFILSPAFQSLLPTTNWMYPAVPVELPPAFAELPVPTHSFLLAPEQIAANKAAWVDEFTRAFQQ